jgi:WD40 repeat protein
MSVAWRFDGKLLASGGVDNKIILWDPKKGERLKTLEGHRLAKFFFFGLPRSPGRGVDSGGRGVDDHNICVP